jgi:hypothetical protein
MQKKYRRLKTLSYKDKQGMSQILKQ